MSGLLRLFILLPLAFVAGMLYERQRTAELCERAGGTSISDVCVPDSDRIGTDDG
jgi:hypothetical protein